MRQSINAVLFTVLPVMLGSFVGNFGLLLMPLMLGKLMGIRESERGWPLALLFLCSFALAYGACRLLTVVSLRDHSRTYRPGVCFAVSSTPLTIVALGFVTLMS